MPYSKSFPKKSQKNAYPSWEEVFLTEGEEKIEEIRSKNENVSLMKECIEDAKMVFQEKNLKPFQTDMINMAIALFEKRASHVVYHKERRAKEKFDSEKII